MKWFRGISYLVTCVLLCVSCNPFRPAYPATYTPPVPTLTRPVITLQPTSTPEPKSSPVTPTPRTSPLSVIWMINSADQTITGIDPKSRTIVDIIKIDGTPRDIVTGENGIWVVSNIDVQNSILLRIDPYSHLVSSHIPAMQGEAAIVTAGDGFVWLGLVKGYSLNQAAGGGVEYSRNGAVMQVDPNPSKITHSFEIPASVDDIIPDGNTIWVLGNRKTFSIIYKIDLKEQTVTPLTDEKAAATGAQQFAHFTKLGSWLWMTPVDKKSHYIYQVDSATGLVNDKILVGYTLKDSAVQITQDGAYLWAALRNGKIIKMDPASLDVVSTIETGSTSLTDIFFLSGYLWVIDEEQSQVYQIDVTEAQIVADYSTGSLLPDRPTPTITETINPELIWVMCQDAFKTQLKIGDRAAVNTDPPIPNRIREEAGGDARILGYIEPGEVVKIIEGPICMNGWVWWKVTSLFSGLTGWTSEGDGTDYWLVPHNQ